MNSKFTSAFTNSGIYAEQTSKVSRRGVLYDVQYTLPEEVREKMPMADSAKLHGIFLQQLYCDPKVGDRLIHGGLKWEIAEIIHYPVNKGARKVERSVSLIVATLIGEAFPQKDDPKKTT